MRFETMGDFHRAGGKLWTRCLGCGKIRSLTPVTLTGGAGGGFARPDLVTPAMEQTTIEDVKRRLKCVSCGGREFETTVEMRG